jgi:predicted transcriptional regulator
MKPYCEIIVKEVLPGLRSAVAIELAENYKLNQSEIARLLGVSQPSISQYLRKLRGREKAIIENKNVNEEVKKICQAIYEKKISTTQLVTEFCNICKVITSHELVCPMHKSIYKLDECRLCIK